MTVSESARSLSLTGTSEISVAKQKSSDSYSAGSDLPDASIFLLYFTKSTWLGEGRQVILRRRPPSHVIFT